MTSQFSHIVRVKLYKLIIAILLAATALLTFAYFKSANPKLEPLLAGVVTGLIVAIIQYLLHWNEHTEIEAIKGLGIQRILPHRDEKLYYQAVLARADREICVLGNTASRFLEDFAHSSRTDSRTMLEALGRGVRVRILLPKAAHLPEEDRHRAEASKKRLCEIAREFNKLECKYFDHAPMHSLVKVDSECLVGPIFPHLKSKDSPTIHAYEYSPLVGEYLKYFEKEWTNASTT